MHSNQPCSREKRTIARRSLRRSAALAVFATVFLVGCGPDKPEALVASAKEYLAKNDRNAAVIQLKNALQTNPNLAEARFLLGKALLESGDVAASEKELNKANELGYPADQVVPVLARAVLIRGDAKKVIDDFGKVEVSFAGEQGGPADDARRRVHGDGQPRGGPQRVRRRAARRARLPAGPPGTSQAGLGSKRSTGRARLD